jgi:hypothetical protein
MSEEKRPIRCNENSSNELFQGIMEITTISLAGENLDKDERGGICQGKNSSTVIS